MTWADELVVGQQIVWCDRLMTIRRIEIQPWLGGKRRRARWLYVEGIGERHRLHYWDTEQVRTCNDL